VVYPGFLGWGVVFVKMMPKQKLGFLKQLKSFIILIGIDDTYRQLGKVSFF
jgi:hypothetical protein